VIALLLAKDPGVVHEAAKRGVFAYIVDSSPEDLQSAIDITLQRFTEYHSPAGRIRAPGDDRAGEGDPDGPPINAERAFQMLRPLTAKRP
jgi:hypothetical protein